MSRMSPQIDFSSFSTYTPPTKKMICMLLNMHILFNMTLITKFCSLKCLFNKWVILLPDGNMEKLDI